MNFKRWRYRLQEWRGNAAVVEDLTCYQQILGEICCAGRRLASLSDSQLQQMATALRADAQAGQSLDGLLVETFALVREVAHRVLRMCPFDVQVIAEIALHEGKLVEMQTGEGKTLAAVLPASLNALTGRGIHILTFNDYLARRDAAWMGPVYQFLGLTVAAIQEGMGHASRQEAYQADITYATAKEAGFDFLRMYLCRDPEQLVHRAFHYAIIDEADSILIDEARVPLVIAGQRPTSETSPYHIAQVISELVQGQDWDTDETKRNVFLTERGLDQVEAALGAGDLYTTGNELLLSEANQALHARALLHQDVDYIVRDGRIELVDEFTGRVVVDRRWPDGLQAALEAKEGVPIQPGGQILGSIALQHFLKHYPKLSGMTATAQPAAEELNDFYGLRVVVIPPNRPCIRRDLPDRVFTHQDAKHDTLVGEIQQEHEAGRPVLVGTSSIQESEALARRLGEAGIECQVLNAKNDEAEAGIIACAGTVGAVTISTNMAGRGTDIKLGGPKEELRDEVVALGGLYVIGTNRHESRRVDDQLRGRAGRQGDPGTSRFFVSLEDDLMMRFGIDALIPPKLRPSRQQAPLEHPVIQREVERLQRIVEGQNYEIRKTLWRYSLLMEEQRQRLQQERMTILMNQSRLELCSQRMPDRYAVLRTQFGEDVVQQIERAITLHHIDQCWADYLSLIAQIREGIHLVRIGGMDPLQEFHQHLAKASWELYQTIEERTVATFAAVEVTEAGIDLRKEGLLGPSSTWTYLINDRAVGDMQQMLFGQGSHAFSALAVVMTWPLLVWWSLWRWLKRR